MPGRLQGKVVGAGEAETAAALATEFLARRIVVLAPGTSHAGPPACRAGGGQDSAANLSCGWRPVKREWTAWPAGRMPGTGDQTLWTAGRTNSRRSELAPERAGARSRWPAPRRRRLSPRPPPGRRRAGTPIMTRQVAGPVSRTGRCVSPPRSCSRPTTSPTPPTPDTRQSRRSPPGSRPALPHRPGRFLAAEPRARPRTAAAK